MSLLLLIFGVLGIVWLLLLAWLEKKLQRDVSFQCFQKGHRWEKFFVSDVSEMMRKGHDHQLQIHVGHRCRRCGEVRGWNFDPELDA